MSIPVTLLRKSSIFSNNFREAVDFRGFRTRIVVKVGERVGLLTTTTTTVNLVQILQRQTPLKPQVMHQDFGH